MFVVALVLALIMLAVFCPTVVTGFLKFIICAGFIGMALIILFFVLLLT